VSPTIEHRIGEANTAEAPASAVESQRRWWIWDIGADAVATADRVMAAAAEEMEITVEAFFIQG